MSKETTKESGEENKNALANTALQYFADLDLEAQELSLESLFKSGAHFGHKRSHRNPRMDDYVYTTRDGISIIDLKQTFEAFQEVLDFISQLGSEGKQILFVGTKKHAKQLVRSAAERCESPYVTERWLGGTFTNFSMIKRRVKYLKDLERKLEAGELSQYTKFERMKKAEEVEKLEKRMGGLREMGEIPAAIFTTDIKHDHLAVQEAKRMKVLVIAIVDTNDNPEDVDFPIPANNDALSSLKHILAHVCKANVNGKKKIKKVSDEKSKK